MRHSTSDPDVAQTTRSSGVIGLDGLVTSTIAGLTTGVDRAVDIDVDALADTQVHRLLAANETAIKRLTARRAQLAHTLTTRAAERARQEQPDDARAPERARRDARRKIAQDHRLTPSQAKQADDTGRQLAQRPRIAASAGRGDLSTDHLRLLNRTLGQMLLAGSEVRDALEEELLEAARELDAVAFGKLCRRRICELDAEAAQRDLDQRHARRSGRLADTPDGMTRLSAEVTGVDAEWLDTAVHAFRRPDASGELRTSEQRTADAVVDMARAALSVLDDPDARGARPIFHVIVGGTTSEALANWSFGEALHSGPLPRAELERVLGDSHLAAILGDARRLPVAVTEQVRTVPTALWRLLVARDGGCIFEGCDAMPAWCDVMHMSVGYADGGKLSPQNAALGCRRHHRLFDRGVAKVTWDHGRPTARATHRQPMTPGSADDVGSQRVSGGTGDRASPDQPPARCRPPLRPGQHYGPFPDRPPSDRLGHPPDADSGEPARAQLAIDQAVTWGPGH